MKDHDSGYLGGVKAYPEFPAAFVTSSMLCSRFMKLWTVLLSSSEILGSTVTGAWNCGAGSAISSWEDSLGSASQAFDD